MPVPDQPLSKPIIEDLYVTNVCGYETGKYASKAKGEHGKKPSKWDKKPFCSRCLNAASIETKQMRSLIDRRYPWDTRIVCLYCNKKERK